MFSKIDKKILTTSIIILAVILLVSFFAYKYFKEIKITVQDSADGANIENTEAEEQIDAAPQPSFTVCVDQCGDGICQPVDADCGDDLNCVCSETIQDCPSDCK